MSWFSTVVGWLGYGRLANPERGMQSSGNESHLTESGAFVSDEDALTIPAVYACIRVIVNSGSTLPLRFYRRTGEDSREKLPESDPMVRLLHRRPNGWMNARELRAALWFQRVLWGNAFAHIRRRGDGQISALVPMKPGAVSVFREDDGTRFEYTTETGSKTYWNRIGKPPEIFHWRNYSGDGVMGLSPINYARPTLGTSSAAQTQATKSFSGRPSGVLTVDTFLKDEQRKQLMDLYSKVGAGGNQGQWWLLEGGMKYMPVGLAPDDLQMIETRTFQVAEVCRIWGVPTVMIDGGPTASTWPASYEKQVLAFLQFTLKPYLEEFEAKMDELLADDVYAEHSVEGFLRADSQARAGYLSTMVQNGIMTRNEARKLENLPAMEGADDLTIQVNLKPADELGDDDDVTQ